MAKKVQSESLPSASVHARSVTPAAVSRDNRRELLAVEVQREHAEHLIRHREVGEDRRGDRPGGDLAQGNFVNPTLFADVDNSMSIAREEVFGPVAPVVSYSSLDEAVAAGSPACS